MAANPAVRHICWLAWRDFRYELRLAACLVLALTAVLAPLLVLFGLKFGLIDTLTQRLVESPQNRELVGIGSGRYDRAWFERLAARADVGFVVPNTRRIAASFSALRAPANGHELKAVPMLPTAPGDPLLAGATVPARLEEVVLSALTAQKLEVAVGDRLEALLERRHDDRAERLGLELRVIGIAPEAVLPGEGLFVLLNLLTATEDYRDGANGGQLVWTGSPAAADGRVYARFRLYAKSINDVIPLRDALLTKGIEVRTQAAEIEAMQDLDRNLSRVFWLVAGLGSTGFLASLAANLLAGVDRKRRELSVLRLLGFPTRSLIGFPSTQAVLIAGLGGGCAVAASWLVAAVLNAWFADSLQQGELICRLRPLHILIALAATLVCALAASVWAGWRVARIEPAAGLRDM